MQKFIFHAGIASFQYNIYGTDKINFTGNYLGPVDYEVDVYFQNRIIKQPINEEIKKLQKDLILKDLILNNLYEQNKNFYISPNSYDFEEHIHNEQFLEYARLAVNDDIDFYKQYGCMIFYKRNCDKLIIFIGRRAQNMFSENEYRMMTALSAFIIGLKKGIHLFHGAAVISNDNKANIFYGKQDSGKTTLCKTQNNENIINDELIYLKFDSSMISCSATPWSFSTEWDTKKQIWYEVDGMFLLKKAPINIIEKEELKHYIVELFQNFYFNAYNVITNININKNLSPTILSVPKKVILATLRFVPEVFDVNDLIKTFKTTLLHN